MFVFPDPEIPIINILYGRSGVSGQYELISFMIIFFCNILKINQILLDLCLFHMHIFLLNQLIAFPDHHLNLKQSV